MGTTDANNIYFYEETDPVSPLHTLLNTAQQSVSDALDDSARTFRVADVTERAALFAVRGASVSDPLFVFRADAPADHQLEYTTDGTTWKTIAASNAAPYATAAGTGTRTFSGATASGLFSISFPAGRFTQPPLVHVWCTNTGLGIWFGSVATSVTSANVQGFATGGAAGLSASYAWSAIQQTAASATG